MKRSRLEQLYAAGRVLAAELDQEALLAQIVECARDLTDARYAALGVLDEEGRRLQRFITCGMTPEERARTGEPPEGQGILGLLIAEQRPVRIDDLSAHPRAYGFPIGHPEMTTFLGVPIMIDGEMWGSLYLTEREDGEPFDEEDEDVAVALAGLASPAVRNAVRYGAERRRRAELERAVRAFQATTEISRALAGEIDLQPILELVVKRARALVDARSAFVSLIEGDELAIVAAAGTDRAVVGARAGLSGTAAPDAFERRRAQRFIVTAERAAVIGAPELAGHAALGMPLRFRGSVLGLLSVVQREAGGPGFEAEDEALLESFAVAAAGAVAVAEQVELTTLRRAMEAAEQERARWARELHDETLQDLGAVMLVLDGARAQSPDAANAAEKLHTAMAEAVERLAAQVDALRRLITDLRPAALDRLGVEAAVETFVNDAAERAGVRAAVHVDLDYERGRAATRHVEEFEVGVYRIVQEAVTNAIKHGHPETMTVAVSESAGWVEVRVTDDGSGFDVDAMSPSGFGLAGMRERVSLLNGELSVRSSPDEGTTVRARVPAPERRPQAPAVDAGVSGGTAARPEADAGRAP